MDNLFYIIMIGGRIEHVKAERYELATEPTSERLLYNFYGTPDEKLARCFIASEDIIGIIPEDMRSQVNVN